MQIAVVVDKDNRVTDFEHEGNLVIYEYDEETTWKIVKNTANTLNKMDNPHMFREYLNEVCNWLGTCKVLAASRFRGTYRTVFESFQIDMWEMNGFSKIYIESFLNSILEYYLSKPKCDEKPAEEFDLAPLEVKKGFFSVDLTDVMAHNKNVNSKQVLLPFFKTTKFKELEILCDHVPKWFAKELPNFHLRFEENIDDEKYKVKVYPT